ncbi:6-phosphogluconolactonase [Tundrisphaera lichenicola]|uniref:6-phosphogluconolactonase n=1 Tax=Tundrisphaera lichenicola TaxID=2029860 RepID=UPI003EBDBF7A
MIAPEAHPVAEFTADSLRVIVHEDRVQMGRAAAESVARAIAARQAVAPRANVVFAAAPSQNEFLAALIAYHGIDWTRVVGFHMDEYLGLESDHPASFRRYLQERIFRLAGMVEDQLRLIPGEETDRPLRTALAYEQRLIDEPTDIVCAGIGENGHLAFNDPPVADFLDPVLIKVVRLDAACRTQQLNDGCFDRIEDVPTHAYTLTVPALLAAPVVSVVVPGPRKAEAVLATVRGPIDEHCPATALRRHPGAVLHLDRESARLIL